MIHAKFRSFLYIMTLTVIGWGGSEVLQQLLVEPRIGKNLPEIIELSPLYPIAFSALMAGYLAGSVKAAVFDSAMISFGYVVLAIIGSWVMGIEYVHDIWVGDPGFMWFVGNQLIALFILITILAGTAFFTRKLLGGVRKKYFSLQ